MFCRSLARYTVARRAISAVPLASTKVFVPRANKSTFTGMEKEGKDALRRQILETSAKGNIQNPILEKIKLPQGLSPILSRILLPLIETALTSNNMSTVRKELKSIVERITDPLENEAFEQELALGTLAEKTSPEIFAALQELDSTRDLKHLPELYESFVFIYGQVSIERNVTLILPGKPTAKEVDTLENELKAFYYKSQDIDLNLKIRVDPVIGAGRIYCFEDFMLNLTTKDFTKNLRDEMNAKKNQFVEAAKDLEEIYRKPINSDLPPSNTLFKEGLDSYINSIQSSLGLAAPAAQK